MRVAGLDPRQAMKWSAAARQMASKLVIGVVLAGIGNLRFKVSQTLPRPPEEQVQITDLIGECRKMGLSRLPRAALRGVHESAVRKAIAQCQIIWRNTTRADGTTDATKADAMWDAATHPAKQRDTYTRQLWRGEVAASKASVAENALPREKNRKWSLYFGTTDLLQTRPTRFKQVSGQIKWPQCLNTRAWDACPLETALQEHDAAIQAACTEERQSPVTQSARAALSQGKRIPRPSENSSNAGRFSAFTPTTTGMPLDKASAITVRKPRP